MVIQVNAAAKIGHKEIVDFLNSCNALIAKNTNEVE
jgi:hypothetical protein